MKCPQYTAIAYLRFQIKTKAVIHKVLQALVVCLVILFTCPSFGPPLQKNVMPAAHRSNTVRKRWVLSYLFGKYALPSSYERTAQINNGQGMVFLVGLPKCGTSSFHRYFAFLMGQVSCCSWSLGGQGNAATTWVRKVF